MSLLDGVRHRMYVLWRGEGYAHEVEREMRFHLELDRLPLANGERDAELAARRSFGSTTYYREEVRRMTLLGWIDRIRQDASYAARGFKRSPGFTAAVVLTLALGIGVNGAMFSLLDRLFVQPPSGVVAPRDVRRLYLDYGDASASGGRSVVDRYHYAGFRAIVASVGQSVPIGGYMPADSTMITVGTERHAAQRSYVMHGYFSVLGARPALGRFFSPEEEGQVETPTPVAVISDALWHRAFAGDPRVLGRELLVGRRRVTVVGVALRGFAGVDLDAADVWIPANMYESPASRDRGPWYTTFGYKLYLIARIPNAAVEQQVVTLATAAFRSVQLWGLSNDSTVKVRTGPIVRALGPMARDPELTVATRLASVSLIVLIIACANVTNLLLLRAAERRREIAIRRALGVSGARLYEQLAVESLLLAMVGGAGAIVFAVWASSALRRLVLPKVHWAASAVDLRTVLVVGVLTILVGFLASLAPALQAVQPPLADSLKAGTREGGYHQSRLRSFLLIVQAALAVVLLVGAGLFMRSLDNVRSIDVGYDPDNLTIIRPVFADAGQHDAELKTLFPKVAERLRGIDGVEAVGYTSNPPLQSATFSWIPRLPAPDSFPTFGGDIGPSEVGASPDYFRAVGLRITAGRAFSAADGPGAPKAVIVSETMARLYWRGQPAVGKCLIVGKRTDPCSTVVGVVVDAHRLRMIERKVLQFYIPLAQSDDAPRDLVIRARAGRMAVVAHEADLALRQLVPGLDGTWNRRFSDVIEPQLRPWRLGAMLLSALGALALLVAGIGIYSVVAYGVSQRTHEMGIRIALGARVSDILDLVVADGIRVVAIGIGVGVLAALGLGQLVASLLFGVTPRDPAVLIGAAAVLCGLGLLACVIPGWRAARVDPATALRAD